MNKEEIRRNIFNQRLSLTSEEIENKSHQIFLNLLKSKEYINFPNIMF